MRTTSATTLLVVQLKAKGLPRPQFEYRFHPERRWRFDLCWVPKSPAVISSRKVAVEIDGGVWVSGRHNRGSGYVKDLEKLNAATELGWRVLRYCPAQIESGEAIRQLERILGSEVDAPAET